MASWFSRGRATGNGRARARGDGGGRAKGFGDSLGGLGADEEIFKMEPALPRHE